jgi:hypothetical protein
MKNNIAGGVVDLRAGENHLWENRESYSTVYIHLSLHAIYQLVLYHPTFPRVLIPNTVSLCMRVKS